MKVSTLFPFYQNQGKENFLNRYGEWGLVAGAAEGLGAAFCQVLARRQMNVILVDTQEEKMERTAEMLEERFSIKTRQLQLDLSGKGAPYGLMKATELLDCRLIIYNAAYGPVKPFLNNSPEELDLYVDLSCRTPIQLCRIFAEKIKGTESGGIILMSSLAGLFGTQLVAPYGATKAFDYNLAEALHYELKPDQIDVLACCAGAIDTPNYQKTRPLVSPWQPRPMDPDKVAEAAVRALGRKALVFPGFGNRLAWFFLGRVLPRFLAVSMVNRIMAGNYENGNKEFRSLGS